MGVGPSSRIRPVTHIWGSMFFWIGSSLYLTPASGGRKIPTLMGKEISRPIHFASTILSVHVQPPKDLWVPCRIHGGHRRQQSLISILSQQLDNSEEEPEWS
ncbi:hypothetical protein XENTR_v10004543 [Xenopus tropicalis]|nr:hypothetical protein XENTR_v10004543 [Xenopus tropicalis]